LADRLAHRRARHAEPARELHLVERLAGGERAAYDVVRQLCAQSLGPGRADIGRGQIAVIHKQGHQATFAG
jgi:hypothetical protein